MAAPLVANPWTLDWLLGSAELGHPILERGVLALGVVVAVWGVWSLRHASSRLVGRTHALLLGVLVLLPCLSEVAIRVALARDLGGFRNPRLFADPFADDDYWRLTSVWNPDAHKPFAVHPTLGWSSRKTARNPLGIVGADYAVDLENPVLVYGDSFIAAVRLPSEDRIPQILDQLLPDRTVYNVGHGGYGFGQIYLRYHLTHGDFESPAIVIGVFVGDLDRTILSVRTWPKPRFRVRDGELVLDGAPIPEDLDTWREQDPIEIRSYLLAFLTRNARQRLQAPSARLYRRGEKEGVNRALVAQIVRETHDAGQPLLFVAIPEVGRTDGEDWRYDFLAATFEELRAPWVDVRAAFGEERQKTGTASADFYGKDRHLNPAGNAIVAREIAEWFREASPDGTAEASGD